MRSLTGSPTWTVAIRNICATIRPSSRGPGFSPNRNGARCRERRLTACAAIAGNSRRDLGPIAKPQCTMPTPCPQVCGTSIPPNEGYGPKFMSCRGSFAMKWLIPSIKITFSHQKPQASSLQKSSTRCNPLQTLHFLWSFGSALTLAHPTPDKRTGPLPDLNQITRTEPVCPSPDWAKGRKQPPPTTPPGANWHRP